MEIAFHARSAYLVFRDEERHLKMRVRLVMALVLHEQMYLDNDYLTKGHPRWILLHLL